MARRRPTNGKKLETLEDAVTKLVEGESVKSIARRHGVQLNQIGSWRTQTEQLVTTKRGKKSVCKGRASRLQAHEELIVRWAMHQREAGFPLTCRHLVLKACEISQEFRELEFTQ